MTILTLDISTKCGWATRKAGCPIQYGTFVMPDAKNPKRLVSFYRFIMQLITDTQPDIIIYEAQFFRGSGSHLLMWLAGYVNLAAQQTNIKIMKVHNQSIKKQFAGTGKATKEQMIARCKRMGINVQDDNQADAVALLYYYMDEFK